MASSRSGTASERPVRLGTTALTPDPTIYAVSSSLAELHMDDVGLETTWHDVPIPQSLAEEVWHGVRRKYWELPGYRLPIAKMRLA